MSKRYNGSRVRRRTAGEWVRHRRTKRIIIALVVVLAVLAALFVVLTMWIKPPSLNVDTPRGQTVSTEETSPSESASTVEPPQETTLETAQETEEADVSLTAEELSNTEEGRKEGYYTMLVVGQDTTSGNTDTILLVTLDTVNTTCSVMSIPRDTMVNVPWTTKKINSVYNQQGIEGLMEQVGNVTGIDPDFYVKVQWEAVGTLVDAIGGVNFDVPYDMNYDDPAQDLYIHVSSGYQLLDGELAMQVVRWRKNNDGTDTSVGDIGRMQIQQDFLMAVADQTLQLSNLAHINKLVQIFKENVETDLTLGNLVWFASMMKDIDTSTGLDFCILPADIDGWYNSRSYVFATPEEILEVVNAQFNPYTYEITEDDLEILGVDSDGDLTLTSGTFQ